MSKIGVEEISIADSESMQSVQLPSLQSPENICKKRTPKRILHFCDGTLEEYSTDEDDFDCYAQNSERQILEANAAHLAWAPWFWYQAIFVGGKALAVCDYLGETLANFFGILSPKYEYELEQYKRALAEEEEKRKQDAELGSFSDMKLSSYSKPIESEPQSNLNCCKEKQMLLPSA